MREWFITGADLCGIIVKAESFDEALAHARKINPEYNPEYNTGQVIREV